MKIIINTEKHRESLDQALKVIKLVTEETEEEQFHRYNTDPIYRNVANHLADTYLTIKTNTSFQIEQEALNIRVRNIIEGK